MRRVLTVAWPSDAGGTLTVVQRRQLLRLSLMCGDVSSNVRDLEQHLLWTGLLAEEFKIQVCCNRFCKLLL